MNHRTVFSPMAGFMTSIFESESRSFSYVFLFSFFSLVTSDGGSGGLSPEFRISASVKKGVM